MTDIRRWTSAFEIQDIAHARWLAMEGLRGLAVTLVFFVHYSELVGPLVGPKPESLIWFNAIHEIGNEGVDLFFVISGFLIYKACIHKPLNLLSYTARRFERIYPTFLVVLVLYITVMLLLPSSNKLPATIMGKVFYVACNLLLLPGMLDIIPIITVAWSLSYEAFFYALAPLAVITMKMRTWRSTYRVAFFVTVFAVMTMAADSGYFGHYRATMFLGGMLLYEIKYHQTSPAIQLPKGITADSIALVLLVLGTAMFTFLGTTRSLIEGTVLNYIPPYAKFPIINFVFTNLVYRCLFTKGQIVRIFSYSPLRWLGNMSYSYYLFHGFALQIFFKLVTPLIPEFAHATWLYLALLLPAFVTSIALSIPLYLFVERPFSLNSHVRGKGIMNRLTNCVGPAKKSRVSETQGPPPPDRRP